MSKLTIDVEDLTLGEIEEFESASGGTTISDVTNGKVSAKAITALVYIFKKRDDDTFSLDDARSLKLSDLNWADEENPTDGGS